MRGFGFLGPNPFGLVGIDIHVSASVPDGVISQMQERGGIPAFDAMMRALAPEPFSPRAYVVSPRTYVQLQIATTRWSTYAAKQTVWERERYDERRRRAGRAVTENAYAWGVRMFGVKP